VICYYFFHFTQSSYTAYKSLPSMDRHIITLDGRPGWMATFHSHDTNDNPIEEPVETLHLTDTNLFIFDWAPAGITERWTLRLKGKLVQVERDALFEFGVSVAGRAKLWINGELIVDNWTRQRRGDCQS
jgi:beta-glucosidase